MINFLNRVISFSFYAVFLLVPLAFTGDTSELFEFNKLWLTFGLTIIIVSAWICKMILEKRIRIQRTPLDIPILLFLASQFISTLISLDTHTSIWGYYSRFNGGFLSLLSYAILYYAFVSNIKKEQILRLLTVTIISGVVVSLWGLPSHFGYDPTCLVFRGKLDVSCWTVAFQPKVRIFSTLGQPDWLSAYLAALIPLSIGLGLYYWNRRNKLLTINYLLLTALFYLDFLYSRSRGGFAGLAISLLFFFAWYFVKERKQIEKLLQTPIKLLFNYYFIVITIVSIVIISFLVGTSIDQIDRFDFSHILSRAQTHPQSSMVKQTTSVSQPKSSTYSGEMGGTDSAIIRSYVWKGAVDVWKHYPIFGTGVETYAYAYYLFMPPGHNMTSEFGYLYNKAHNEYLNYLATTGIVGLGTYLLMVGWFLFVAIKVLTIENRKLKIGVENRPVLLALITSYIGILIINFFGFSVVIINIFLFIIPAFVFILQDQLDEEKSLSFPSNIRQSSNISAVQWMFSTVIVIVALYLIFTLIVYWNADKAYGLGQNLVNVGEYQAAYQPLHQAVSLRPGEPTFKDELALDDAILAVGLAQQAKSAAGSPTPIGSEPTQLAQEAVTVSNDVTSNHPNVVTFWKTRVRIMYALSQLNPQYFQDAFTAVQKAAVLAPTDAKISYNLGLLLGQTGHVPEAINVLQNTIKLKPDYKDAYYALGIFYHSMGVDKLGKTINAGYAQKAIDEMHFILNNFSSKDQQTLDALKAWGVQ